MPNDPDFREFLIREAFRVACYGAHFKRIPPLRIPEIADKLLEDEKWLAKISSFYTPKEEIDALLAKCEEEPF